MINNVTRQTVEFNPSLKTHRGWFAHFVKTGSMRDCPVQFKVKSNESGNPVGTMQRMLVEYYTQKEFTVIQKVVDSIAA